MRLQEKKLKGILLNRKAVYVSPSNGHIRLGFKGELSPASVVYRLAGKSTARRLRKELRKQGFARIAAVPPCPISF